MEIRGGRLVELCGNGNLQTGPYAGRGGGNGAGDGLVLQVSGTQSGPELS